MQPPGHHLKGLTQGWQEGQGITLNPEDLAGFHPSLLLCFTPGTATCPQGDVQGCTGLRPTPMPSTRSQQCMAAKKGLKPTSQTGMELQMLLSIPRSAPTQLCFPFRKALGSKPLTPAGLTAAARPWHTHGVQERKAHRCSPRAAPPTSPAAPAMAHPTIVASWDLVPAATPGPINPLWIQSYPC